VLLATQRLVSAEDCTLVERLLYENISPHGIYRVVGVSLRWLMDFVIACFRALPDHLSIQPAISPHAVIIQRLDVETDDMGSVVEKQAHKPWRWLAMDTTTRQVMASHVSDRSRKSAEQLWANLPAVYRERGIFDTDYYEAYNGVISTAQHQSIRKKVRKTDHIERFHNTLRQRVSRLVRDTLAFSRKLKNYIGVIRYFICHDNLTRAAALHL
jgi:insertion element IS1 protein InsB